MHIYRPHAAALAFPPLKAPEMEALKRSILQHGQLHPAVVFDGKLLDGRNRQEAIRQLVAEKKLPPKTELRVQTFGGGSIPGYVDAANDKRRHLSESQRSMVAAKLLPLFHKEAKERQAAAAKASNRRRKKSPGQKTLALPAPGRTTAAQEAAQAAGGKVSARSVERAAFVQKTDPELARKVFEGELTVKQAEGKIRKRVLVAQAKAYKFPEGQYPVIVTDWPWKYRDQLDGSKMERGLPYPPQSIEEICASIERLPVADDCALFCWVTNGILIDPEGWPIVARQLFERWGFVAKQIRTWVKTANEFGDPIIGQGWVWRNDTEHLIRLERGRPVFKPTGAEHGVPIQHTAFEAPIGEHSEKPQVAYDDIAAICAARPLLELHARAPRPEWVGSGSELTPLAAVVDSSAAGAAAPTFPEGATVPPSPRPQGAPSAAVSGIPEPTPESLSAVADEQICF